MKTRPAARSQSNARSASAARWPRLGLTVTAVYVDNDLSATSGVARPAFERLLNDAPPAIIAWHQDRLLRKGADLERVITLNVPVYTVSAGTLDLTTPAGRAVARTVAAWSQYEGEQKALRQLSKNAQLVDGGMPVPGKRRFGFEPGNVVERPEEAEKVREWFAAFLAGKSVRGMAVAVDWRPGRMRDTLSNPAYAGWVVRRGERFEAHPSVARIVSREDFERVQAVLADPSRKISPGGVRRHLLTGVARCGVEGCGAPLHYSAHGYTCNASTSHVFIGGKDRLEGATLAALEDELIRRAGEGAPAGDAAEADRTRAALNLLLAERKRLSGLLTDPDIDAAPIRSKLAELRREIETAQGALEALESASVEARMLAEIRRRVLADADPMAGVQAVLDEDAEDPKLTERARQRFAFRNGWAGLSLDEQRALVAGTLTVVLGKGRGADRFKIAAK